jgi:hydroxyacylglutathione hydrolase
MDELAPGVWLMRGIPPNSNAYVVGDVLVDSATRRGARRLLRNLRGRNLRTHALTHVHPPTQGASHAVSEALSLEVWCHAREAAAMESGNILPTQPRHWFNRFQQRFFAGPGHPVARKLAEGDEVADFTVLEAPGHAPGHIALWRESDRVLILGDVVTNENVWTGVPGLREPPAMFTPDPARNRESARRLAALEPALTCFSHGRPLRDGRRLQQFVAGLPA